MRPRRFKIGTHHHIAGLYLFGYAADCSWRQDNRRVPGKKKVTIMLAQTLGTGVPRALWGYWRRCADDPPRFDIWEHVRDDSLASMMH